MTFTPIYTTIDNVKVRLANKIQFQSDSSVVTDGEMPDQFLAQLIVDAETKIEQDLRGRYAIPFRSKRTGQWVDLPDHSQRAIRMAVDYQAVIMVLDTDFGRGTHVTAEGYSAKVTDAYKGLIARLLGRDQEGENEKHDRFRFSPPLDDVLLAVSNRIADDGYKGMIINTDASNNGSIDYAIGQVNDPSESYQSELSQIFR